MRQVPPMHSALKKDGKELRPHNPHNTLVYSMAKFTPEIQATV